MRTRSTRRLHRTLVLGVGVVVGLLGVAAYATGVLDAQERSSLDVRFSLRGSLGSPRDIVIVAIDSASLSAAAQEGVGWPFPRSRDAKVIDRLAATGAKVIAVDLQFTQPTTPTQDNALIESIGRAGNVVLATTQVDAHGRTNVLGGGSLLRSIHATVGDAVFPTDAGGVIRRVPYSIQGLPSFAVAVARRASGHPVGPTRAGGGSAWLAYVGPPGTVRSISFERVLGGSFDPALVRGKIVVVGPTATVLQDVHATPTADALMPGAEVEANAISTALRGFPLRSDPAAVDVLLVLLLAFVPAVACVRFSPLPALGISLAAGVVYAGAAQLAFSQDVIVALVVPLATLALATVASIAGAALVTAFERERIRDLFGRFVPDQVVDQVLAQTGDDLRLGGELRVCTMLFTDLRGFTTFSESRGADEVIRILNQYLSEMTQAVLDHGGTLVSYLGDGLMAVFGAPLEQSDHADRALAAAREMLVERLPRVNAWIRENGFGDGFRMGIGLNTGPTMTGNVGSERRLAYTTIGDTVNLASRLESLTKGTSHPLFVAQSTRDMLAAAPPDLVYVDELEVRGRVGTVRVWTLEGVSTPAPA